MASSIPALTQTLRSAVINLIAERDRLRAQLHYAMSTIDELERQNQECTNRLDIARKTMAVHAGDHPPVLPKQQPCTPVPTLHQPSAGKNGPGSSWIGGTWLCDPETRILLGPAERAWQKGRPQEALNLLIQVINGKALLSAPDRVNTGLLFSVVLRSSGDPQNALQHSRNALLLAKRLGLNDLVGKSYFHCGLCYFYLDRYADASWAFVLAAYTSGHTEQVEVNRELAEKKRRALSPDDPRRVLSVDFS